MYKYINMSYSRLSTAVSLLTLTTSVASSSLSLDSRDYTCEDVHIFLARGGNEPYPGRQGVLVDAICAGQTSCGYEDILFDATIGLPYATAMAQGASSGVLQITNYANACPDAKLVLSGYSLGAGVVGDTLAGADAGDTVYDTVEQDITGIESATTSPGNRIAAALLFGDTRHAASQTYNVLSGADANSYYPRPAANLATLANFAGVLRSYCDGADPVCASGDDISTHLSYFELYTDAAAAWVRSKVGISASAATTQTPSSVAPDAAATTAAGTGTAAVSATLAVNTMVGVTSNATAMTTTATGTASATGTGAAASASASGASGAESIRSRAGLAGLGLLAALLVL